MASEEKDRDDKYWQEFSETGVMPAIPDTLVADKGEKYVLQLLKGQYNQLSKILLGEVLARNGTLDAEGCLAQLEAAKWLRPMIFSKKKNYDKKREMAASADAFLAASANPEIVRLGTGVANERKLRNWPGKAKEVFHGLPGSSASVRSLIDELNQQQAAYKELQKDAVFRNLVLFWLGALMAKMKKNTAGIGIDLGRAFVRACRTDGLDGVPDSCWERRKIDPPPAKGKDYFPATIEKIVVGIYGIIKDVYGKLSYVRTESDLTLMEWVLQLLQKTANRLPDEWSDFRIGTLLRLMGRVDEAKTMLMPVIRKKHSEFWAWDMLGQLYPDYREACLAKALLCHGEEQMMVRVKREAQKLKLPITDKNALAELADGAADLLFEGLPSEDGVYERSFKTKEGKFLVMFVLKSGAEVKPVSPQVVRLPRNLPYGTPVTVYLDEQDPKHILAVRLRKGDLWDVIPTVTMAYYGLSKKGRAMLSFEKGELTCATDDFACLSNAKLGDEFLVRYTAYKADYGIAYDVKTLEPTGLRSSRVFTYEGSLKIPNGVGGPGFVEHVFIAPLLLAERADNGFVEGTPVRGLALRLAPRQDSDCYGRIRTVSRTNALTIEKLSGENLERYKMERCQ